MIFKVDIKKVISILLVSLFLVSISNVSASAELSNLKDNEEVTLKVFKEKEDVESAADACVKEKGIIKEEDGKRMLYLTLTDNGDSKLKGYLNNVYYYKNLDDYNNDVKTSVNVIKSNSLGYPEEISMELTSDTNTIYIGFKIIIPSMPSFAMNHKARLIYNVEDEKSEDKESEEDKDDKLESESNILDLKDGTYIIPASFIKTNSEESSMANSCLNESAKLVVENGVGKIYLTLKEMNFAGSQAWITNLWFYNNTKDYENGVKNLAEVISTNNKNYPEVVAFTLPSKSDVIYLSAETNYGHNSLSNLRLKLDYTKASEQKYKDGLYEVEINLLNAAKDEASMASSAINNKALININDGKAELYLSTKPLTMGTITASLQTLQYEELNGKYTYATVTTKSKDGTPTGFKFILPSYNEILNVKVNPMVAMMGNRDISARLKIDYSTMVLSNNAKLPTEDDKKEEVKEEIKDDKKENNTKVNLSNGNVSESTNDVIGSNATGTLTNTANSLKTGDNSNVVSLAIILMISFGTVLATKKSAKRRI